MSDLIDRKAAIDALNEYFVRTGKLKRRGLNKGEKAISLDTVGVINSLPSAQSEVIRCKDCWHYPGEFSDCLMIGWARNENDYCSKAEVRHNE